MTIIGCLTLQPVSVFVSEQIIVNVGKCNPFSSHFRLRLRFRINLLPGEQRFMNFGVTCSLEYVLFKFAF